MAVEIITTVLVAATAAAPAQPYDLTDLACAHDELALPANDTTQDGFLSRAITQSSAIIASYCDRVFPVEIVQDQIYIQQDPYPYQVPGGVWPLQLKRWPLQFTPPVTVTGNSYGTTTIDTLSSTAGLVAGAPFFGPGVPLGTVIASIDASASSLVLSLPTTTSGAAQSFTAGMQVIQTWTPGSTQTLIYGTDYTIDAAKGWLIRLNPFTGGTWAWEATPTNVQYAAGFPTIPSDLEDACLRLITARYRQRGRDPMLIQQETQGLGVRRYWVPQQDGMLPPEIAALVDHYRVPVAV